MNPLSPKYVLVGTVAAGLLLFLWGVVSNVLLPGPMATMAAFKDSQTVLEVLGENTKGNGIYFAGEGIFTAVSLLPDRSDRTQNMSGNLAIQLLTDLFVGFLLASLLGWVPTPSLGSGFIVGMEVAVTAGVAIHVPYWNWFGFSESFILTSMANLIFGFSMAGLLLVAIKRRFGAAVQEPTPAPA